MKKLIKIKQNRVKVINYLSDQTNVRQIFTLTISIGVMVRDGDRILSSFGMVSARGRSAISH